MTGILSRNIKFEQILGRDCDKLFYSKIRSVDLDIKKCIHYYDITLYVM